MGLMHLSFLSKTLGFMTNVYLIMPTEHHEMRESFPVLYLLHGGAGNAQDWIRYSNIENYAQEHGMVVVMPEVGGSSFYGDMVHGYDYYTYITEELTQLVTSYFPVSDKASDRYVAGFSMGGYGAFKWAFNQPGYFKAAGNFSGISFIDEIFDKSKSGFAKHGRDDEKGVCHLVFGGFDKMIGTMNDTRYLANQVIEHNLALPKLFTAIGVDDFSYEHAQRYVKYLKNKGIMVHHQDMAGDHEWKVWDEAVKVFIPWALHSS
jgi:putative tributyrin esterase